MKQVASLFLMHLMERGDVARLRVSMTEILTTFVQTYLSTLDEKEGV